MKIHLKPAPGRRVRDPASALPLSAEGATVTLTPFWSRRLEDEDVVQVEDEDVAPVSRTAKKTKEA